MELIVGAFLVLGLVAILSRFITRDEAGQIRLPRIVDDSIGMWALRRITRRRLWERGWYDDIPTERPNDPDATDGARTAPRLGQVPARRPSATIAASPTPVLDLRKRLRERERNASLPTPVTPVFLPDSGRRYQARRMGLAGWAPRVAALGSVVAVLIITVVALGAVIQPRSQGAVLDATGRPSASGSARDAIAASGAAPSRPVATPSSPHASPHVIVTRDATAPVAAIVSIQKSTIPGRSGLRVTVHWSISESGSGVTSQLFQRRTDSGSWVTVSLASPTTRSVSLALARGHTDTFRVRATDRAGNIGAFASRLIRI